MLLLSLLAACTKTTPPPVPEAVEPPEPALAVLLVVDQLPERLLKAPAAHYTAGLKKLTGPDAAVRTARYAHAITYTCPGHATISTGASPSVHGIISNDWWDPETGEDIYCADPAFLRVGTLADRVVEAGGDVVSVALKDRAAMMLGGAKSGLVSWYDKKQGRFSDERLTLDATPYFTEWTPLHPEAYAALVGPDDNPNEGDPGLGTTFPHPAPNAKNFLFTPMAGDYLVDIALEAVDQHALGTGGEPDLLALSFSQTDYIGHAFTAESWEAMDGMVRLDRTIGRLLDGLDERLQGRPYAVFLTSDHGSSVAEGAVRIPVDAIPNAANAALKELGIDDEVHVESPSLWLPSEVLGEPRKQAALAVAQAVSEVEGVGAAIPWRYQPPEAGSPIALSLDEDRSGDIYVMRAENALYAYGKSATGTSHGTSFAHDTDVPFLAWGPGITPGAKGTVDVRQVAPTIAAWLGVEPPSGATEPAVPLQ